MRRLFGKRAREKVILGQAGLLRKEESSIIAQITQFFAKEAVRLVQGAQK